MKINISKEIWNKYGQPTVGNKWHLNKNGKKMFFNIIEQGWNKQGVFLKLTK